MAEHLYSPAARSRPGPRTGPGPTGPSASPNGGDGSRSRRRHRRRVRREEVNRPDPRPRSRTMLLSRSARRRSTLRRFRPTTVSILRNRRTCPRVAMAFRFDQLTAKSQEAVQQAQSLARDRGHQRLEPMHLLAALLDPDQQVDPLASDPARRQPRPDPQGRRGRAQRPAQGHRRRQTDRPRAAARSSTPLRPRPSG